MLKRLTIRRVVPSMIVALQFITWNLIYYCIDFGDSTKLKNFALQRDISTRVAYKQSWDLNILIITAL
jgi:hypothetical protein